MKLSIRNNNAIESNQFQSFDAMGHAWLPKELWAQIASHISVKDALTLRKTCKFLRAAALDGITVLDSHYRLLTLANNVSMLRFNGFTTRIANTLLRKNLDRKLQNVTHMSFTCYPPRSFLGKKSIAFLSKLRFLERLSIAVNIPKNTPITFVEGTRFEHITELECCSRVFPSLTSLIPNLHTLTLQVWDSEPIDLTRHKTLTSLHVQVGICNQIESYDCFLLPTLEHLSITAQSFPINKEKLVTLSKLKTLRLRTQSISDEMDFQELTPLLSSLHVLPNLRAITVPVKGIPEDDLCQALVSFGSKPMQIKLTGAEATERLLSCLAAASKSIKISLDL